MYENKKKGYACPGGAGRGEQQDGNKESGWCME